MPRRPGRTRQRWPQAKHRTAPPSSFSTNAPSRTRASSTWPSVAAPPSGASWVRKEVMVRCVMGGPNPEYTQRTITSFLTHDAPDGGAATLGSVVGQEGGDGALRHGWAQPGR